MRREDTSARGGEGRRCFWSSCCTYLRDAVRAGAARLEEGAITASVDGVEVAEPIVEEIADRLEPPEMGSTNEGGVESCAARVGLGTKANEGLDERQVVARRRER